MLSSLSKVRFSFCNWCIFTLIGGLIVTSFAVWRVMNLNESLRNELFSEIASERHQEFLDITNRHERFLNSINAMLFSHFIEPKHNLLQIIDVLEAYIGKRDPLAEFPGLFSWGLTKRILPEDLESNMELLRSYYPDFTVSGLPQASKQLV